MKPMKKSIFWLFNFLLLGPAWGLAFSVGINPAVNAGAVWKTLNASSAAIDLRLLATHPDGGSKLIAASRSQIFESSPGRSWTRLWQTDSPASTISRLLHFKSMPDTLFVLTSKGLYAGNLRTKIFEPKFMGSTSRENNVLSLAVHPADPAHWFLGTESGLFESQDSGKKWTKCLAFGERRAPLLFLAGHRLLVGDGRSLFFTEEMTRFVKVFDLPAFLSGAEPMIEDVLNDTDQDEIPDQNFEFLSPANLTGDRILWLGTNRGVFESRDEGRSWQSLPQSGLKTVRITSLLYHENTRQLFAGTSKGIYRYDFENKRWEEHSQGLDSSSILDLTAGELPQPVLFAATEAGISYYPLTPEIRLTPERFELSPEKSLLFHRLVAMEPSFREFQEAVIRYNDLDDGKIRRWQIASRLRSLLPSFSFGRDFSSGRTIDAERTSTYSPIKYVTGPDDITSGWDFNVSWNTGDLLWNSAQTSIDSRSKIDSEFRRDLLAEAARTYYERRRLQMEIASFSEIRTEGYFEKLIRLDELTSLLDTFSGGYFSARLEPLYARHPELNNLWIKEPGT